MSLLQQYSLHKFGTSTIMCIYKYIGCKSKNYDINRGIQQVLAISDLLKKQNFNVKNYL